MHGCATIFNSTFSMLVRQILAGRFAAKDNIKVDCKGGVMKFDKG